jgi:hypothetical protein
MANRPLNPATDPTVAPTRVPSVPEALSAMLPPSSGGVAVSSGPGALRSGTVVAETYL